MTTLVDQQTSTAIPTPPDFPVGWSSPEDALLFWTHDRMHFPNPLTPMMGSMLAATTHGFSVARDAYDLPILPLYRRINGYAYLTVRPVATSPAEMEDLGKRAEQKLGAMMGRLDEVWKDELLPEIMEHMAFWEGVDLARLSMPALARHLDETAARMQRLMEVHFLLAFPFLLALSEFDEFYRDLSGSDGPFTSYQLLQGLDNKTLASGRALWRLSRQALGLPEVRAILEERAAADVIPALLGSTEGRAFLDDLHAYLASYGQRGSTFFELTESSWIEDPTPVLKNLKDYVTQPDRDPEADLAALAAERERLIAETRARLQGYPRAVADQFEFLLHAAQAAQVISEDHNFWIDYQATYKVRRVLLECARRLAGAGVLEEDDDIFYLTLDELRESLAALPDCDLRALVAERRAEMARLSRIQPPPALGTAPSGPQPDDPMNRALGKFFGGPPQRATEPGILKGNAGSPGTARGRARIIRSLAEASKLERGDVLVTETTAPPWTPLFATAAAVVTDTGGILSHCAVVAREYRIPAVVGIGMATAVIRDGQILEVDGTRGIVRIVAEEAGE